MAIDKHGREAIIKAAKEAEKKIKFSEGQRSVIIDQKKYTDSHYAILNIKK